MKGNKKVIVCAACMFKHRTGSIFIMGVRHWDLLMVKNYDRMKHSPLWEEYSKVPSTTAWEQGFVDNFNNFYDRTEAMKVVLESGQYFDPERNGPDPDKLFSEGIY